MPSAEVVYAVFERLAVLPGGNSLFEPGLQMAGETSRATGTMAARTFAAI